jgi:hypothetical protein
MPQCRTAALMPDMLWPHSFGVNIDRALFKERIAVAL